MKGRNKSSTSHGTRQTHKNSVSRILNSTFDHKDTLNYSKIEFNDFKHLNYDTEKINKKS